MPQWVFIILGLVGGVAVIGGAIYLAFRPYLAVDPPHVWMPEPTGRNIGTDYVGGGGSEG